MRSKVALMSAEVSGEPSWNLMPSCSVNVYVNPSGAIVQLLARSPTICDFSVAFHLTSSEYCGVMGCSSAKVCEAWQS